MPYIKTIKSNSLIWKSLPQDHQSFFLILAVNNNTPLSIEEIISNIKSHQKYNKEYSVRICLEKCDDDTKTTLQEIRSTFHQIDLIPLKG